MEQSLKAAADEMWQEARKPNGTNCPCCTKHVQIYCRKFNSRMAATMIYVYRACTEYPGRWLEIGNFCAKKYDFIPGDHGKLLWWGLIERKPNDDTAKKSSGKYRITEKGRAFVERRLKVPSHVVEYMSVVEKFEGKLMGIDELLGKHFHYQELMHSSPLDFEVPL
jgi:hypothetical protein